MVALVNQVGRQGTQVYLHGCDFPVTLSWYWLKTDDGTLEQRFVVSTQPLSGHYITMLGKRRWHIEGFFKVVLHRFGLHRFGQATLKGVYRWRFAFPALPISRLLKAAMTVWHDHFT